MARDTKPRARNGRLVRNPATINRDATAASLRGRGWTYDQIAAELGFADRSAARKAVERAMRDTLTEPANEARQRELDRLDALHRKALDVLERQHVAISQGHVVRRRGEPVLDEHGVQVIDAQGKPEYEWHDVADDGPVLAAIAACLKIQERRSKLLGLDMPAKSHVTVERVDPRDLELTELLNEAKAKASAEEAQLRGDAR